MLFLVIIERITNKGYIMSKATESYEKLGLYISNDGFTFDISKEQNYMDNLENISIKTTGSKTLCMGNILSFFKNIMMET